MSVQYAGYQFMTDRLVEVIQELRDYLGPEAHGLSDEGVVHKSHVQGAGVSSATEQVEVEGAASPGAAAQIRTTVTERRPAQPLALETVASEGEQA